MRRSKQKTPFATVFLSIPRRALVGTRARDAEQSQVQVEIEKVQVRRRRQDGRRGRRRAAKEAEQDRDMTHAYAEDLKTDIYTDVNANPKALVHSASGERS